ELQQADDVKGIVVVDEIDLHLHARLQYAVLPKLINMFPNVQFVLTTHSPLFILGLQEVLGEDGFGLYDLPSGQQLSAEDFGEFGMAYEAFVDTKRHTDEVKSAVQDAQKPLVFVEGPTDVNYMKRAAALLEFDILLTTIEFREGGGANLKNVWKGLTVHHVHRKKVIVLHDPECGFDETRANVFRRSMYWFENHPIQKGIENLFSRTTLEHARENNPGCIDVIGEHPIQVRGIEQIVPETWSVNEDEKTRLCSWLCQNGTADDFEHFRSTLEMLCKIVEDS
ncbi:MAG: AAA family ATPase, partial [Caldilineaceae bacterium SB0666_bin_21]|nr:AAA family ATPase [Caldilineaceae bacterium SB0666_bin_21]